MKKFRTKIIATILALMVAVVPVYAALTDDLVLVYEFQSDGTDAHASNDLTANNTPTFVTGKVGNATDLERSSSQYFSMTSNADVQFGDEDMSCVVWVNLESLTDDMNIISKGDGSNGEYSLQRSATSEGKFRWDVWGATGFGSNGFVLSEAAPSTSTWYFIFVYHNAATNELGISVNDGTVVTGSYSSGILAGSGQFEIGAYSAFGNHWDGLIDQVACWHRVISSSEVTQMYNSGNGLSYAGMGGAGGGITFAEASMEAQNDGGCDPCVTPAINVAAGNTVVATMRWDSADTISAVTADIGDTPLHAITFNNGTLNQSIYYVCNASADATYTVSFNMSANAEFAFAGIAEYSGLADTLCLDETASGTSSGTTSVTSNSFSTIKADELIFVAATLGAAAGTWTVGSGVTDIRATEVDNAGVIADKIVSATQSSVTATMNQSDTAAKVLVLATFADESINAGFRALTQLMLGVGPN